MDSVLIVIHLLIIIALIVVILMQRSEGGALGIGGGGGGGLMTGRGAANALTKITTGLAAAFIIMSIVLAIRSGSSVGDSGSVTDQPVQEVPGGVTAPGGDAGGQAPGGEGTAGGTPAAPSDGEPGAPTAPTQ